MTNARKIWIKQPKSAIEGWRIWVEFKGARKELSQVNGNQESGYYFSAFDNKEAAIQAAKRFYS